MITLKNKTSVAKSTKNYAQFTVEGYTGIIYFPASMFAAVPTSFDIDLAPELLAAPKAGKTARVVVSKDPVKAAVALAKAEVSATKAVERATKAAERAKKLAELVAKMAPATPPVTEDANVDENVDESVDVTVTDAEEAIV